MSLPPFPNPSAPLVTRDGVLTTVWARYFEAMHEALEARLIPAGGADNAVLTKQSADDFDADWE